MDLLEAMDREELGKSVVLLVSGYAVLAEVGSDQGGKHLQIHIDPRFKKTEHTTVVIHEHDMEKLIELYLENGEVKS